MTTASFLSYDEHLDWLEVAPYGTVMDRQGPDRWIGLNEQFGFFHDADGDIAGFKIQGLTEFDPEDPDVAEIFGGPRFTVPALGLSGVPAGEIVLAARPFLGGRSTADRVLFSKAIRKGTAKAWRRCLEAGNQMAHYGLGYTLLDHDRPHEAYRHLRFYTELVPNDAWAWDYRGRAAWALGDTPEAVMSWRTAVELEDVYGEDTDAREHLAALGEVVE